MKTRKTSIANRRLAPATGYVGKALWHRSQPDTLMRVGNRMQWSYTTEDVEVEVMAQVGKYLMIRRPGCMPFVETTNRVTFTPHTDKSAGTDASEKRYENRTDSNAGSS